MKITFGPKTNQELFSQSRAHLLKQGKKSYDHVTGVDFPPYMYRNPEGLMCAIGCFIPDDKYNKDLEGQSAQSDTVAEAAGLEFQLPRQYELARQLQKVHDSKPVENWREELDLIAKDFDLKIEEDDTTTLEDTTTSDIDSL